MFFKVRWRPFSEFLFAAADFSGAVTLWDVRASAPLSSQLTAHEGKTLCLDWISSSSSSHAVISKSVTDGNENHVGGNRRSRRNIEVVNKKEVHEEQSQWAILSGGSDSKIRTSLISSSY